MQKKSFQELNSTVKTRRCIIPWLVSSSKNPDTETNSQFNANYDKLSSLPESVKNKLASNTTGEKIQQIGNSFNLELLQLADISRAIRNYYFGELKLSDFPVYLTKELPIDSVKAQKITRMISDKIINDTSLEQASQANIEKLTLADALKMYPEIGEQAITTDRIRIMSFPEPARPSVKNWLADYTSALGQDNHDSIVRGNYLFHSNNAKTLSSSDREKLSYILKAFDEKTTVTVDKASKKIVFSESNSKVQHLESYQAPSRLNLATRNTSELSSNNTQSQLRSLAPSAPQAPINRISFSSPQKLAYEKNSEAELQPYKITPTVIQPWSSANSSNRKTFGKNVVNLKESQ